LPKDELARLQQRFDAFETTARAEK